MKGFSKADDDGSSILAAIFCSMKIGRFACGRGRVNGTSTTLY